MDKTVLKRFAVWAHDELLRDGDGAVARHKSRGGTQALWDAAASWFVQICALRCMDVNGFLPQDCRDLNDAQAIESALHCQALHKALPRFFVPEGDRDALPQEARWTVIRRLWSDIPREWFDMRNKSGQIEIVGWLYQYFLSPQHDDVVDPLHGKSIAAADIPVATQVFTTDWVVRYIVDNSLGRLWLDRHPQSALASHLDYYIPQKANATAPPRKESQNRCLWDMLPQEKETTLEASLRDIRVLDPCVGCGHFLVYVVDVLMIIYRECGYTDVDAIREIMQNHIYGLDIDERIVRIAHFALVMKGCQYDRDFLHCDCKPQVFAFGHSDFVDAEFLGTIGDPQLRAEAKSLAESMRNARVTGSMTPLAPVSFDKLMQVPVPEQNREAWTTLVQTARLLSMRYSVVVTNPPYLNQYEPELKAFIQKHYKDYAKDLFSIFIYRGIGMCHRRGYCGMMTPNVWMFIKSYEKLRRHIVTEHSITTLVQMAKGAFFQDATVDVCAFVVQNGVPGLEGDYFRLDGFSGDMDHQKQRFQDALRDPQCGYRYRVSSQRFSTIPGMAIGYWADDAILRAFRDGKALGKIAAPRQGLATTDNRKYLRHWYEVDFRDIGFGLDRATATASEIRWFPYNKGGEFRKWYGNQDYIVDYQFDGRAIKRDVMTKYPYLKNPGYVVKNPETYFRPSLSWSKISSGRVAFRYFPQGFLYDVSGCSLFFDRDDDLLTLAGFLNSAVCSRILEIVSPTLNYEAGHIGILPILDVGEGGARIREIVRENIAISREDWDTAETSWDFMRHPLLPERGERRASIAQRFQAWDAQCAARFRRLKQNEEELNRIFIERYGLQGQMSPEVRDRDVTVRRADVRHDVKSLISYAVGCMFGRYSPDRDGLCPPVTRQPENEKSQDSCRIVQAQTDRDTASMSPWLPSTTEIIPISEDGTFPDDIANRFGDFLAFAYGPDSLEDNIAFIANALGGKGTPRDVIRSYFAQGFYADHYKMYQKCPIYWQFTSGNAFSCLVYIHRYRTDTMTRIVSDYIEKKLSLGNLSPCAFADLTRFADKLRALAAPIERNDGIRANMAQFADVLVSVK